MSDKNALIPVEQREVGFYGDTIIAVRAQGGGIYVPIRPICDLLGVDWSAQRRRITRDPVMGAESMSVAITTTDIDPDSRRPRTSEMLALPPTRTGRSRSKPRWATAAASSPRSRPAASARRSSPCFALSNGAGAGMRKWRQREK